MRKCILTNFLIFIILTVSGQGFQKFLNNLENITVKDRQNAIDQFLKKLPQFPVREHDSLVFFIYRGDAEMVQLAGDVTGWKPGFQFSRIEGTNFWYYPTNYPPKARLDYKFVIDGKNWIMDPMNPDSSKSGFGYNSELRMPENVLPPEVIYYENIPHGKIQDTVISSKIMGNSRQIKIYLPPGYPEENKLYPLVLFHDGLEYLEICKVNHILDFLISNRMIRPLIAVFVPPVDREAEYAGAKKDQFTDFIINEFMKDIDIRYHTDKKSGERALVGASNGGNIALYIAVKHPEIFGKVAAQSSNVINEIPMILKNTDKNSLYFYLDIGKYDIDVLIPMVRKFHQRLLDNSFKCQFHEWDEGHSWSNWKEHLRYPLLQFFSTN